MSELPMRRHFRYLRFKTFPMTPRTPQCKVFCPFLSSSKHSGVPEGSKSPTFPSVGLHPTLGQVRVATVPQHGYQMLVMLLMIIKSNIVIGFLSTQLCAIPCTQVVKTYCKLQFVIDKQWENENMCTEMSSY